MLMINKGMETQVFLLPYEKTGLGSANDYSLSSGHNIIVQSVVDHENSLVKICLPEGEEVIVNANQLMTAIQKCILS